MFPRRLTAFALFLLLIGLRFGYADDAPEPVPSRGMKGKSAALSNKPKKYDEVIHGRIEFFRASPEAERLHRGAPVGIGVAVALGGVV